MVCCVGRLLRLGWANWMGWGLVGWVGNVGLVVVVLLAVVFMGLVLVTGFGCI